MMMRIFFPELPDDAEGQRALARKLARRCKVPQRVVGHAGGRRPAERIAYLFPQGIIAGALFCLRAAEAHEFALPRGIESARDDGASLWADGLARSATLPPKAAFSPRPAEAIPAIYRAGFEEGFLLVLEAIGRRIARS